MTTTAQQPAFAHQKAVRVAVGRLLEHTEKPKTDQQEAALNRTIDHLEILARDVSPASWANMAGNPNWLLDKTIAVTLAGHPEYRAVLTEMGLVQTPDPKAVASRFAKFKREEEG